MFFSAMTSVATLFLLATTFVEAAFKPPINSTLEPGVATECKTCPYSLCTNKEYYDYNTAVSLICWTTGTDIGGDTTWLQTSDGCYVTQYDLVDYAGTWETDLSFCGKASTANLVTYHSAKTKYDSECNICPDNADCETVKYIKYGTDISVTCWTDQGGLVIDDSTWLKTKDNCYVAEIGLEAKADRSKIDYCGPVGFLQLNYTGPAKREADAEPAPVPVTDAKPAPVPEPIHENIQKRYLINITVGEDYAKCHTSPNSTSSVVKKYPFDHKVWMQCYVDTGATNPNETYWYETIDFCYVREVDFWESLFDQYRFPACSLFESGSGSTVGK